MFIASVCYRNSSWKSVLFSLAFKHNGYPHFWVALFFLLFQEIDELSKNFHAQRDRTDFDTMSNKLPDFCLLKACKYTYIYSWTSGTFWIFSVHSHGIRESAMWRKNTLSLFSFMAFLATTTAVNGNKKLLQKACVCVVVVFVRDTGK